MMAFESSRITKELSAEQKEEVRMFVRANAKMSVSRVHPNDIVDHFAIKFDCSRCLIHDVMYDMWKESVK